MTQEKHYGTITHWFSDMHRGAIMPDTFSQRIFADSLSLAVGYLQPRTGDHVCFEINHTQGQLSAHNIQLTESDHRHKETITITLAEWDLMQNGGFGLQADNPNQPIFILGQFLTDQSRVPEVGDQFEGTLFKHQNGQWMMSNATLLQTAQAEETVQITSTTASTPDITTHDTEPAQKEPQFVESIYKLYKAPEPQTLIVLPTDQVISGTITSWDDAKGYGFIRFGDKSQNIFFHISAFHYATKRPQVGQQVCFFCKPQITDERQKAAKVVLRGDERFLLDDFPSDYNRPRLSTTNMPKFLTSLLIGITFFVTLASYSRILACIYFVFSAVSYLIYKFDKQIAQTSKKKTTAYQGRVPENKLHLIDALGGWPGALVSRAVYQHKTSKISFIRIFWLTVVINIAITYALLIHYADNPLLSLLRN